MSRWYEVLETAVFPRLCAPCRRIVEHSLRDLCALRGHYRRLGRELRRHKALARRRCDELLALPPARRRSQVLNSYSRFRSRPLAEELLRRSLECAHGDAERALELADLAWEVAESLFGVHDLAGGLAGVADTKGLAAAHCGNACRVLCRWDEADGYFQRSSVCLLQGSGDPLVNGEVLLLEASLHKDRHRFPRAIESLAAAERLFNAVGDARGSTRAQLLRASIRQTAGDSEAARAVLEGLLERLDPESEPGRAAVAWHNLAATLCELKLFEKAEDALEHAAALAHRAGGKGDGFAAYLSWTRGKVLRGMGYLDGAVEEFLSARRRLQRVGNPYEAALVGLDLAVVLQAQGTLAREARFFEDVRSELRSQDLGLDPAGNLCTSSELLRGRWQETSKPEQQPSGRPSAPVPAAGFKNTSKSRTRG